VIAIGDTVAKWTLSLFGVEMTGAWLETEVETFESRAELRARMSDVLEKGDLPDERRDEVLSALDIDERTVGEIAVPVDDVVYLSTEVGDEENVRRIQESPHTRYPLIGEEPEDFQGIVYAPALLRSDELAEVDLEEAASPPMTIAGDTAVSDAIDMFQAEGHELALVMEKGEVVGLVTVTDAVEEVTGELEDPLDEEEGG
jgi:IMP dehydrogenase